MLNGRHDGAGRDDVCSITQQQCSEDAVLYPPGVNPYGIHGMGGGLQKFQMDSMEWGMDSIILVDGFHGMGDGFHTFPMEWGMDSILF